MACVLVTRPEPAAARTAARLTALGYDVILAPMLKMSRLAFDPALTVDRETIVVVTSARAIEAVASSALWAGLVDHVVVAVGEATAEAARVAGAHRVINGGGTLAALIAFICDRPSEGGVLYLAGRHRSGDLVAALAAHGVQARLLEVYEMAPVSALPVEALEIVRQPETPIFILIYSRRTAIALSGALSSVAVTAPLTVLAISEQAAGPVRHLGPCHIAPVPDEAELIALLERTC